MEVDDDPREVPWHPRHRHDLVGHEEIEQRLLHAIGEGRLHHGLLLGGPAGIGKATLAYRLARFLLAGCSSSAGNLAVSPDHPVSHRISARGHADLLVLERPLDPKTKKLKSIISVDDTRRVTHFFNRTAAEGGWRICIIDPAEDLNLQAANALLKTLEEPPARSLLILVSSTPGMLLPTVRSRTLHLHLNPLDELQVSAVLEQVKPDHGLPQDELAALARLSGGSPGRALQLLGSKGAAYFAAFRDNRKQGRFDLARRVELAGRFAGQGVNQDFDIFCGLLIDWLAQQARSGSLDPGNLAHNAVRYAKIHHSFTRSLHQTNSLNLDRRQLLASVFEELESARQ